MSVGGILKSILTWSFYLFAIAVILTAIPELPPYANFSIPFRVAPSKPLTGTLALNDRLNDVEIWHKGDFRGPEAFVDLNGELYTSLYFGDIVKLTGEHITPVAKFGKPCKQSYEERVCGRPLGMAFDKNGLLVATDCYYGLFRVNVETGDKEQLVSPNTEIEGKRPKIFNSVAITSNGDIYWTDSSTDFLLDDGALSFLADPSGRLLHYDPKTKRNRVLLDSLHFANGVALSEDQEFIIVAETAQSRIHRYYLKGPKKGTHDIFIDGLPGFPDNLKADGKGGFLVPLIVSKDENHPAIIQTIGPFPRIRKAIARIVGLAQLFFIKTDQVFPNEFSAKAVHFLGHFTSLLPLFQSTRSTLLRVDRNGQITDSVHNLNKKISSISEVHVFRDELYLGSPFNDYIARIPLAKVGWEDLKVDRVKRAAPVDAPKPTEVPKQTTSTPKPTTTTPRPTTTTSTTPPPTTTPKPTTTTPKPTTQKPTTPPAPKKHEAPQPKQRPPTEQTAPPVQRTPPAPKQVPSQSTTPSPKQAPPKQKENNTPPKQQTPPPVKQQAPPPVKETPPKQKEKNTPPKQQTPPPVKQQAPPPVKEETPPPVKQQTPPVIQQSTVPKQDASQAQARQKQTPPSKEQPKPATTSQLPSKN